jgi:hypothetical protein
VQPPSDKQVKLTKKELALFVTAVTLIFTNGVALKEEKSKGIPVTGRGELQGCEMSRIPHFLGSRQLPTALYSPGKFLALISVRG